VASFARFRHKVNHSIFFFISCNNNVSPILFSSITTAHDDDCGDHGINTDNDYYRSSSSSSNNNKNEKLTAVSILIDLDNMSKRTTTTTTTPSIVTRPWVAHKIRPLQRLAKALVNHPSDDDDNNNNNNKSSVSSIGPALLGYRMVAIANEQTQSYKRGAGASKENREALLLGQEYWEPIYGPSRGLVDDELSDYEDLFDGAIVQTGYDEDGNLRCGVCGARMKFNKKEKNRPGFTVYDKLKKHMKMLHDREQSKRKTRLKQLKSAPNKKQEFLAGKQGEKMRKYSAAQVGLGRGPKNDWFRILKEERVERLTSANVDATLMKTARTWVKKSLQKFNRVIVVVVSEDSDFADLFNEFAAKNYPSHKKVVTVTATWLNTTQTPKLVNASDMVVTLNTDHEHSIRVVGTTPRGQEILQELGFSEDKPLVISSGLDET
jgi:hypothetical protein